MTSLPLRALLPLLLVSAASASYCGQAAIPFSFQALTNGQPVLGCARPSCFGWRADGTRAADSAQFFKIFKRPDGFLRKTDIKNRAVVSDPEAGFVPQFAKCEMAYNSTECSQLNQWVGGIAPATNVTDEPIKLQCCTYTKLQDFSAERGEAEVRPGQIVIGGEVTHESRQFGFDYISNVRRELDENGKVVYTVTMKRFPCIPEPNNRMKIDPVDQQVREYLLDNIAPKPKKTFEQQKFDLPDQMPSERVQKYDHLSPRDADPEQVQLSGAKSSQRGVSQVQVPPALMPSISDSAVLSPEAPRQINSKVPTARISDNENNNNLNIQKIERASAI
ncbi:hypothetical protein QR680_018322 [Steinernema hermaphroditum]|uniref:Uncharacterized protein n=1 Tax=Steinernema hermaphroditum TaxID=289476 RepID=A0AA39LQK2_9BILA|nr:hypothetical protein QR680_018322 [Steinernema hermaphroditum]